MPEQDGRNQREEAENGTKQEIAPIGHPLDKRGTEDLVIFSERGDRSAARSPIGCRIVMIRPSSSRGGRGGCEGVRRRHGSGGPPRRRARSSARAAGPAR